MRFSCLFGVLCLGLVALHSGGAALAAPGAMQPLGGGVAKPKILASVNAKNLEVTLGVVRDYLPVPLKPESALLALLGDMGGQVALSAPVAGVVAVDRDAPSQREKDDGPGMVWAFSVGVRSLDEAQKLAQSRGLLTGGKPGFAQLHLQTGSRDLFCLLSAASGVSGRLSCSRHERDRDVLGPYLAQKLPPNQLSDVHAEILVDEIVSAYETPWQRLLQILALVAPQKLKLDEPQFDRALTDAMQATVGQLQAMGRDLQTIAVDLSLDKAGVDARLAYRLLGKSSWWAQAEAEPATGAGAPPTFFNLPADSSAASFQTSDSKWAKKVLELVLPLIDGYLAHDGLPPADRKAVSEVLGTLLTIPGGPLTTVMSTAKSATPAAPAASSGGLDPAALFADTNYLFASEGPIDWTVPWLKSVVAAYNRPGVQTYLRAKWKKLDPTDSPPTLRAEPLAKALPAGGYGLVLSGNFAALSRSAGLGKAARSRPMTLHIACVPVSGRLWTAVGPDRAQLTQRLGEAMQKPAKTLAQRPGIEPLRDAGLKSGGFTSLVAMSGYLDAILLGAAATRTAKSSERTVSSAQLFNMAPHHGEVPMVYLTRRGQSDANGRTSEVILRVPRMVIEDIAALAMQLALEK